MVRRIAKPGVPMRAPQFHIAPETLEQIREAARAASAAVRQTGGSSEEATAAYNRAYMSVTRRLVPEAREAHKTQERKAYRQNYKRKEKQKANTMKNNRAFPFSKRMKDIRTRSFRDRVECAITVEDIEKAWDKCGGRCPCLGLEMSLDSAVGQFASNSWSVDRIDPNRGYAPDNIWIISDQANRIKRDATFEEFESIYLGWKKKLGR